MWVLGVLLDAPIENLDKKASSKTAHLLVVKNRTNNSVILYSFLERDDLLTSTVVF